MTLRGARMWEFLDRLTSIAIPRIRDFRGLNPRSFDGRGNYTLGMREQIIFPEIDYDAIDQVRGLDVTITTTAETDEEAFALLSLWACPSRRTAARGEDEVGGRRPRRSAATRSARLKAEAEQAALEQLKEENPEAYEKPERPEEARRAKRAKPSPGDLRRRNEGVDGKDLTAGAPAAHAQVQDTRVQPLPQVRPPARLPAQVRPLPDLPARARPRGLHPRPDEDELVDVA